MNSSRAFELPADVSIALTGAVPEALRAVVQQELALRCPGVTLTESRTGAALIVRLATPVTLPDPVLNRFLSAPTIHPYPDYADHLNLRVLSDGDTPEVVIVAGAERAFWHGVGLWLQGVRLQEETLVVDAVDRDWKPHTPIRGLRMIDPAADESALVLEQALWGDNCTTLPPGPTPLTGLATQGHTSPVVWMPVLQPDDGLTMIPRPECEYWADVSLLDERQLDHLMEELKDPQACPIRAVVYGPHDTHLDLLRVLLPFHIQLITLTSLDDACEHIAKTYARRAPMTYGAIGLITPETPSWKRFVWSALSGAPQPSLDDILLHYGAWYAEHPCAEMLANAVSLAETGAESECTLLMNELCTAVSHAYKPRIRQVVDEMERFLRENRG